MKAQIILKYKWKGSDRKMDITGRKLFVKALQEEGVDTIFGYPGGTVTDLFDELYKQDEIEIVLPRHEQGLLHEAEGYAKSTGKVGVCLVTSGPGATNIMTGLADAHYDNIPLVCFTGQVPLNLIGNDAFQEVDIVGMTRSITKYGVTVRDRKDLGKIIKMAFHIASTGKPGPVLIDLPKDIQTASGPAEYPDSVQIRGYKPNESVHIGQLKKAYKLLKSAKKPLILAGGGVNIAKANELWSQSVDIQGMTDSWGQQLLTSGAANIAGGMDGLTEVMQKSGANTVTGLVQGMQNAQKEAEAAGRDLGVKTVESVNNGLGCQSPSKKTKESGKNVDQGLINGMKEKKTEVSNAAKDVAKSAILQFTNECSESKTKTSGA